MFWVQHNDPQRKVFWVRQCWNWKISLLSAKKVKKLPLRFRFRSKNSKIIFFFQKMSAHQTGSIFFLVDQSERNQEFFMLVRVRIEKQVSEVRKKVENSIWNSDLGKKYIQFKEKPARATGGKNCSRICQNIRIGEFFKLFLVRN